MHWRRLAFEASDMPMPALEQFRIVTALLPDDVDAAVKLAAMLQTHSGGQYRQVRGPPEEQLHETIAAWERVLELDPGHHDAHLRLGIAYEEPEGGSQVADPGPHYETACEIEPLSVDAHYNAARCLSNKPALTGR